MKVPKAKRLPSGMWRVQVQVNGQRLSITGRTKTEAEKQAAAVISGAAEFQAPDRKLTLDTAISEYIQIRENTHSPSTLRGYEIVRKTRFPELMQREIHSIKRRDIQQAVDKAAAKYSPKTVANSYGVLTAVLEDYGIKIDGVKLPQRQKRHVQYLSASEIATLIDAARGDSCELPIVMALWLGLRRSEIAGLCWDCVDLDAKTIEIRRTYIQDKNNNYILREATKTTASQRTIKCPEYIMEKLKAMYHGQIGRVFSVAPTTILNHVHKLCKAAGITDTTTHGLRHANAAVMVRLGLTDKTAMARGGWSSNYTFKQVYAYVFPEDEQDAAKQIDDYIGGLLTG